MTDDTTLIIDTIASTADQLLAAEETLTDLDSQIGDADFGVNIRRGAEAVKDELESNDFDAPEEVLYTVGRILISEMAGSSGVLFGKSMMEASDAVEDGVDSSSVIAFAEKYRDNVAEQGSVALGAKTMFDAIQPTVLVLKRIQEIDDSVSCAEVSAQAVKACEYGAQSTIPLRAKKGRASYTEWRSVGHPDPGAVAVLIVVREIHKIVQQEYGETVEPYLPGSIEDSVG
jgi:dihydroxyacetone kinase-like protein